MNTMITDLLNSFTPVVIIFIIALMIVVWFIVKENHKPSKDRKFFENKNK